MYTLLTYLQHFKGFFENSIAQTDRNLLEIEMLPEELSQPGAPRQANFAEFKTVLQFLLVLANTCELCNRIFIQELLRLSTGKFEIFPPCYRL